MRERRDSRCSASAAGGGARAGGPPSGAASPSPPLPVREAGAGRALERGAPALELGFACPLRDVARGDRGAIAREGHDEEVEGWAIPDPRLTRPAGELVERGRRRIGGGRVAHEVFDRRLTPADR